MEVKSLAGGGGVLELFFDGVCGPRSETRIPIDKLFEIFANQDPFLRVFLPKKRADFTIFCKFCKMGPPLRIFFTKMGPMSKDFFMKK